jgi:hypothetical protein
VVFEHVFGGSGNISAAAIALDPEGNICATGVTGSPDFPLPNPLQGKLADSSEDAFVTKWAPDGSQLLNSTYLGGSGYDAATGIAIDTGGNAYRLFRSRMRPLSPEESRGYTSQFFAPPQSSIVTLPPLQAGTFANSFKVSVQ